MIAAPDEATPADQFAAATMRLVALADAIEARGLDARVDRAVPSRNPAPRVVVAPDDATDERQSFADSAERVVRAIVSNVAIAAVAASVVLLLWAVALRVLPSAERPAFASDSPPSTVSWPVAAP